MEFGSWVYSGKYLRPVKYGDDGFSIGGSETAGEAYAEFSLDSVSVEEKIYPPYPAAPSEDWPVLLFHISFRRAWQPYARGYLMLQILLNIVGFASFWLPVNCGERMALAITAVLAAVAADLVVSASLPVSSEVTWVARFSFGSTGYAFAVVLQCAVVIYFYYYTGDDLEPTWSRWIRRKLEQQRGIREMRRRESEQSMARERKDGEEEKAKTADPSSMDFGLGEYDKSEGCDTLDEESAAAAAAAVTTLRERRNNGSNNSRIRRDSSRHSFTGRPRALDADDFKDRKEAENNRKWQKWAGHIDEGSRLFFPATYVIFLAVMFGVSSQS